MISSHSDDETKAEARTLLNRSWYYMVPTGLFLRRLNEVKAEAVMSSRSVEQTVCEWIEGVAMELACQVDSPSDDLTRIVMDETNRSLAEWKRQKGGAPRGNKNATKKGAKRGKNEA